MRLAIVVLSLMICAGPSLAEWKKIAAGPSLEYAKAYCDNAAMGMAAPAMQRPGWQFDQFGRPVYVPNNMGTGFANLGIGIGQAIRRSKFKKNCMVMQGWKNVSKSQPSKNN